MNPEEIAIGSGGARGIVALGAAHRLLSGGYFRDATTFSGCSIGAVIAAGLALDVRLPRMLEIAIRHPLEPDIQPDNFGVDSGKGLTRFIRRLLGLRAPLTLQQAFDRTGKTLRICVVNLTDRRVEYWTHTSHPEMDLLRALRISCSVPFIFAAVKHRGKVYVDGGVGDAMPVQGDPRKTMAIGFESAPRAVNSMQDFVEALHTVCRQSSQPRYVLNLSTGSVADPFDFGMPPDAMRCAYKDGVRQASKWIKKNV